MRFATTDLRQGIMHEQNALAGELHSGHRIQPP